MSNIEFKIEDTEFNNWDDVFNNGAKLELETIKTGTIKTNLSKNMNLDNPEAEGMADQEIIVPVLSHLIKHEKYGYYLIDTGFDNSFYKKIGGSFKGILKNKYFKDRYMQNKNEGIDYVLKNSNIKVSGVFLTHMHEHAAALSSLSDNITVIYGMGEKEINYFPLVYSRFLKSKDKQYINFHNATAMPILGKCVDIFGDGSLFAIHTPGHTDGHISYLLNCNENPVLITGDACVTEKGFELGIEPGNNSKDIETAKDSFKKLKEFKNKYPNIEVIYGHESNEFKIDYKEN